MQSRIGALVAFHVHLHFLSSERMPSRGLVTLEICPDYIVLFACRNALREFATMIGVLLPARFFFTLPPNFDFHSIERVVIRAPDCSENQGIRFFWLDFSGREVPCCSRGPNQGKDRYQARAKRNLRRSAADAERQRAEPRRMQTSTSPHLPVPLPRPLRTPPLPPISIPAG